MSNHNKIGKPNPPSKEFHFYTNIFRKRAKVTT